MFLKQLTIENNSKIIRNITFHKGVNLIVDETKTDNKKESGNNVGKTTVIRLIDYCLGGEGTNIYKDKEFKQKSNTQIENFLTTNNIIITLILTTNLENSETDDIVIKRNFLNRYDRIQEINGSKYNNEEFQKKLKELIFKSTSEKPTFRQIISKNIRDEKNKLSNTLKVLNPYTSLEEYESLYLFWLGIESDDTAKKQQLLRDRILEQHLQNRLKKDYSLSQIKQSLLVINRTITDLEQKKSKLNLNENFNAQITKLNLSKQNINSISTELSRLEFRKTLILESRKDLNKEISDINTNQIRKMYEEAKVLILNIQKSFEETIEFHNQMVNEKIKYITKELPDLENEINVLKRKLNLYLIEETQLTSELQKTGALEGLEHIITDLNSNYEKKGNFEQLKEIWEASEEKYNSISSEIEILDKHIQSKDSIIQNRISEFNKYFSELSYQLYDESFVLSSEIGEKGYELNISSISGNLGTGKKKGQIAAFDLAYIKFAEKEKIYCLHFILHDQIENVHNNQIRLLIDIVSNINCQYIIPILKDKLPSDIDINLYKIISLSQTDKLFKVN
jgi:uncharacterized protein YydD (DUF2326 family)